jgi:hypothetical protein
MNKKGRKKKKKKQQLFYCMLLHEVCFFLRRLLRLMFVCLFDQRIMEGQKITYFGVCLLLQNWHLGRA